MMDSGFGLVDQVFAPDETAAIIEGLRVAPLDRTKAGARHVLKVPVVKRMASDERLLAIARRFLGADAVPFKATLFAKSPAANWLVVWHQDTALPLTGTNSHPDWGPWSRKAGLLYAHAPAWALEQVIALRVSLDESSGTNGPLRVLPDTHRAGVLTESDIERLAQERVPVECVTSKGGVVAMRPLTVHASSKAADDHPRRILHIEYARTAILAPGVELAVG